MFFPVLFRPETVRAVIECRFIDVFLVAVPFHDVGFAGLDGSQWGGEIQSELSRLVVESRGGKRLHNGALQGCASEVGNVKRQAERVPRAVTVEGAARERHAGSLAAVVFVQQFER